MNKMIATFFGIGNAPFASGTVASLAVMPLAFALAHAGGLTALLAGAAAAYAAGTFATRAVLKNSKDKDPSFVVIDEVLGQIVALIPFGEFLRGNTGWQAFGIYAGAFALFRLFDISKPWPACYFDRHVKNAHGVMLDDAVAGAYAAAVLYFIFVLWQR